MENIGCWEIFLLAHPFLVKLCKIILYGDPDFPLNKGKCLPEDKKNALTYLKALESFEFIYTMVTLSHSLLKRSSSKSCKDIVSGVSIVIDCSNELQGVREDIDNYSQ